MSHDSKAKSHRWGYILTGLLGGIIIGFGAALLIQNPITTISLNDITPESDTLQTQGTTGSGKKHSIQSSDLLADASPSTASDETVNNDSTLADGTPEDTLIAYGQGGEEVILRDELLMVKRIKATGSADSDQEKQGTDSLLTDLTAAKPSGVNHKVFQVEFWRNPVNFKGYKLVNDRLILFGLSPDQPYKLHYEEGVLFLQDQNRRYILRETNRFLSLQDTKPGLKP